MMKFNFIIALIVLISISIVAVIQLLNISNGKSTENTMLIIGVIAAALLSYKLYL